MTRLLDTDTCIGVLRQHPGMVDLEKQGMVIGPYDLLIAGHALSNGLMLVTGNVGEFQRVSGLTVESWP